MNRVSLSPAAEDYLKAIFNHSQEGPVGTSDIADAVGVSPASATSMTKKLAEGGLVTRVAYRGVTLTPSGRRIAIELIRHHRLIELFLHQALGVPWDEVHAEAEKWEHVISEDVEARIDELLGFPTHDPHGSAIPTASLEHEEPARLPLALLEAPCDGLVVEVSDSDPALLRYVGDLGLYPGTSFSLLSDPPYEGGPVTLRIQDSDDAPRVVDGRAADAIFVRAVFNADDTPIDG